MKTKEIESFEVSHLCQNQIKHLIKFISNKIISISWLNWIEIQFQIILTLFVNEIPNIIAL